jgi:hypothetical protein
LTFFAKNKILFYLNTLSGREAQEPVSESAVGTSLDPKGRSDPKTGHRYRRSAVVPKSVLEAIKLGLWDFEPPEVDFGQFDASDAMPGTKEKLEALAQRVRSGLPLWHVDDRNDVEASSPVKKPR